MKEPLLWFVLIGASLFVADQFNEADAIVVNDVVRKQIATLWETQMGLKPSDDELDSLVHDWVREEVFYREALRLGLDQEDTIVRRRLVQKLGFLAREVDDRRPKRGERAARVHRRAFRPGGLAPHLMAPPPPYSPTG